MFKDREGNIYTVEATPEKAIWYLYTTVSGRQFLKFMIRPGFSDFMRFFLKTRLSSLWIDPFIKKNNISLKDYIPEKYKSFNDFFTRMIRPERRPVEQNPTVFPSPCDSRASVYEINDRLVLDIKGSKYSVKSLIRNQEIAEQFAGGYCMVLRLTVEDYHRYCYPDNGYKTDDVFLPGFLNTVSPIVNDFANIYAENQRVYTVIDTENFGLMVQMEIGAMGVGRIVNWDDEGEVKRGDEKGFFEFGGSTIVLLLQKDHFTPDADIIRNTADGYETLVKMGEKIGYNEKYQG